MLQRLRITRFQRLLSGLFLLAGLLIGANAWLAFHAEEVLASSERWVTHTLEVITGLEHTKQMMVEAESSVRGYLLTSRQRYLLRFQVASIELPAQIELMEQMLADNPKQVDAMRQAAQISQQKMTHLAMVVQLHDAHNWSSEDAVLAKNTGEELMQQFQDSLKGMQEGERRLLVERLVQSANARTEAKLTVALASGLDILFVAFSLWSLHYERGLRRRAADTASRLEKLQLLTDVGFTQLTTNELTAELLARLRSATETDALVLCRWYDTEIELTAAEGVTVTPQERRAVRPDGAMASAARTGQPVQLEGEALQRLPIEALRAGLGSALVVPMSVSSKVIAMLVAGRERGTGFSAADQELLMLAADRIALSIDRAAAYDAERSARQVAEASSLQISELNAVLEDRVLQRTAELENTNRELEAFSYSVSHDLRAPLRSVDGFSAALEEDYGALLAGEGVHYLGRIRAGVQRMGQLIDALLQLSRITRAEFLNERIDVSELAQSVADEVQHTARGRTIHFSIEPGLMVYGDARLLRVIFENMFGNAVKFTANVPEARISFGWSPERNAYYIRDNGAGFDQQYAGKLFVAFQRLHGDKDFQGSGIGLATVARVIGRHHGTIRAEGVVGQGATFWFTLG